MRSLGKSLDGIIQSWNAAAERLFGYTAEQAMGQHLTGDPPDRMPEEEQIIASLKAGQRIEHYETERMRSDGQLNRFSHHLANQRRIGNGDRGFEDRARHQGTPARGTRSPEFCHPG